MQLPLIVYGWKWYYWGLDIPHQKFKMMELPKEQHPRKKHSFFWPSPSDLSDMSAVVSSDEDTWPGNYNKKTTKAFRDTKTKTGIDPFVCPLGNDT